MHYQEFEESIKNKLKELEKEKESRQPINRMRNGEKIEEQLLLNMETFKIVIHYHLYQIFGKNGKWYSQEKITAPEKENKKNTPLLEYRQWKAIFHQISENAGFVSRVESDASGENLFKDFNKGKGRTDVAIACYYWFHTFSEDLGKGEYQFNNHAHEIDDLLFGKRLKFKKPHRNDTFSKDNEISSDKSGKINKTTPDEELAKDSTFSMKNSVIYQNISKPSYVVPLVVIFLLVLILTENNFLLTLKKTSEEHLLEIESKNTHQPERKKDSFNITIFSDKTVYKIGDELKIFFNSNRNFYARIYYIDSNDNCLYMKSIEENRLYQANHNHELIMHPTELIYIGNPKGIDTLKILASTSLDSLKGVSKTMCGYRMANVPAYNAPSKSHSDDILVSASTQIVIK